MKDVEECLRDFCKTLSFGQFGFKYIKSCILDAKQLINVFLLLS